MTLPRAPTKRFDRCLVLTKGVQWALRRWCLPYTYHVVITSRSKHAFAIVVKATNKVGMGNHSAQQVIAHTDIMLMDLGICTTAAEHVRVPSESTHPARMSPEVPQLPLNHSIPNLHLPRRYSNAEVPSSLCPSKSCDGTS
mmetsp:Transcript_66356/g.156218  ORF Transcript_66356/g.156218 Transcript_66356/m.156218 type:complete len:141 (+) Transcript_66356:556-978(+)